MISGLQHGGFNQPVWNPVTLDLRFRAAPGPGELPQLSTTPMVIWVPPGPVRVDDFMAYEDPADPLIGAAGATLFRVDPEDAGAQPPTLNTFVRGVFSQSNRPRGNLIGGRGATFAGAGGAADGSGVLSPPNAGSVNTLQRALSIYTDAGTATGRLMLHFRFQLVGPWQ